MTGRSTNRAGWFTPVLRSLPACLVLGLLPACVTLSATQPASLHVACYRLATADGRREINQASGLHDGRLGSRDGLWIVCDRNSTDSGNRIFFIDRRQLARARDRQPLPVTEAIPIVEPAHGWEAFAAAHPSVSRPVLDELRRQFANIRTGRRPILDLEAVTVGRPALSSDSNEPPEPRLYVVAEQPDSLILELQLVEDEHGPRAVLTDCFKYDERPGEVGTDHNDGLEAICFAGTPGVFYVAEEGTRPYRAGDTMHFFDGPRLMRVRLADGRVVIDVPWSEQATRNVCAWRDGRTHTLNALTRLDDRTLAAVDRNGGWILTVDTETAAVRRWLNLYDPAGLNLRERLAHLPADRRMSYVSIEGIARDPAGHLWLVDDPAMPEGFRASVLIRVTAPTGL